MMFRSLPSFLSFFLFADIEGAAIDILGNVAFWFCYLIL